MHPMGKGIERTRAVLLPVPTAFCAIPLEEMHRCWLVRAQPLLLRLTTGSSLTLREATLYTIG